MAEFNLYPAALTPDHPSESDAETTRVLGTVFWSDVDTYVVALTWYAPTTLPAFCDMGYWSLTSDNPAANTGTRIDLLSPSVGSMTSGAWNRFNLPTPRFLPANTPRLVQVHTDGHYTFSNPDTFQMNSDDGSLHAYDEATGGNGRWYNGGGNNDVATNQHPGGSGYNFFVGVIVDASAGAVSGTINQVTEAGTVFPISREKLFTPNLVTETGTVFPIGKSKAKIIGQVTETGLVLPVHVVRSRTVGQVTGSGTVFPISAAKAKAIQQVQELGTVQQVSSGTAISKTIGQVIELSAIGRLGPKPDVDTEIILPANRTVINL